MVSLSAKILSDDANTKASVLTGANQLNPCPVGFLIKLATDETLSVRPGNEGAVNNPRTQK